MGDGESNFVGRAPYGEIYGVPLATYHHADQITYGRFAAGACADCLAIAHNSHAMAHSEDFIHFVGHIDDCDTLRAQPFDQPEEPLDRIMKQRTGGLIHDNDAGTHAECASNHDQLHIADIQGGNPASGRRVQAHLLQPFGSKLFDATAVDNRRFRRNCDFR